MHRFARVVVPLALALAVGGGVRAADLLVEWGNPNAYQTLQAALDAAQPGDRILIKGQADIDGLVVVRKSVTIEAFDQTRAIIGFAWFNHPNSALLIVESLTPGLPLTFRRLLLRTYEYSIVVSPGIWTPGHVPGDVRFDDVRFEFGHPYLGDGGEFARRKLIDLDVDNVWLRQCSITAQDAPQEFGCRDGWQDAPVFDGASGIAVTASLLVMEDCDVRAGSGAWMTHVPACQNEVSVDGFGGFALRADVAHSILTRCRFSDGDGGSVQSGAWMMTPTPGTATPSQFVRPGGILDAFDVRHEQGLDGQVLSSYPGPGRGATISIGDPLAPLSVGGSGVLGGRVTLDVVPFQHSAAAMLIGYGWGLIPTPFGNALLDFTLPVVAVPVSRPSISFGVPNDAALVHLPVVSQLFYANEGWFFGNASGLELRR